MCYNCGCQNPKDNMDSPDNITDETFEKAAKAWGQSVDQAKKNTLELLKKEIKDIPQK